MPRYILYILMFIYSYVYSPYTFLYIQESVLKCSVYVLSISLYSYPGEVLVSLLL